MYTSCLKVIVLPSCIAVLISLLVGCAGGSNYEPSSALDQNAGAVATTGEVDAALLKKLTAALDLARKTLAPDRQVSQPPAGEYNLVTDLVQDEETGALTWTYLNTGDYDMNGEVNQTDLTPVAIHFGATPASPNWEVARFADGDRNGEVSMSDITPIAVNYLSTIDSYKIEQSVDGLPGGTWVTTAQPALTDVQQNGIGQMGVLKYQPGLLEEDTFIRVTAYNGDSAGVPSNVIEFIADSVHHFTITGECLDLFGAGLPGVLISLGPGLSTYSGADGSFELVSFLGGVDDILTAKLVGTDFDPPSKRIPIDGQDVGGLEFKASRIATYGIYIPEDALATLNENIWSGYYHAGLFVTDGIIHQDTGLRYRGGTIRDMPKKSWKVKLGAGSKFVDPEWGYDRGSLNLNSEYIDGSQLREVLSYELMRDMGLVSVRARFVKLYVNDEYYGLSTDVENPRTKWTQKMGYSGDGPLYQANGSRMWDLPTVPDYETVFEKQMLEEQPFDDIALFIENLVSWEPAEVNARFQEWIDVDQLLKYMVANCLIQQADQIEANFFWYLDVNGTNKWIIFPWDHDRTWGKRIHPELGFFSNEITFENRIDYGTFETAWGNVVYDRFLSDPVFLAQFHAEMQNALDTYFAEDLMISRIDSYEALVHDAVMDDPLKWATNAEWPTRVEDLRDYVRWRRQFIADELP